MRRGLEAIEDHKAFEHNKSRDGSREKALDTKTGKYLRRFGMQILDIEFKFFFK